MISKNKIKSIKLLEQKKHRDSTGTFVAEGPKVVADIFSRHADRLTTLVATREWIETAGREIVAKTHAELWEVSPEELNRTSLLCHPQHVLAIFEKMDKELDMASLHDRLSLMLDGVQDPGNLGTIIRIADWFGIEHIICSNDTADVYNPKVIQATMGSIARVSVHYCDLHGLMDVMPEGFPVYGTLLEGDNIYNVSLENRGVIVMGNEGKGLSTAMRSRVTRALRIPNFPPGRETADSLNVAVATAVVCSEFRRQQNIILP